jgi:predicted nucleic-acid-binding Zn-ribbon protein
MKLFDFTKHFPTEESCREKFKEIRIKEGVVCPKCGCTHHYWKTSKQVFQCSKCGYRQSLRANTVMHGSKLPFLYWFIAMHLLTATKHTFSASELQRQLGHKRYQPIWEMIHKLRSVMGKRDDKYTLTGNIELDEGFFSTETPNEKKSEKLKAGAGSQKKTKVLVIAESTPEINPRNINKPNKVGHIKMIVIPNLKFATIDGEAVNAISPDSSITTDGSSSHVNFKNLFGEHKSQVIDPKDIGKVLPWVHIAIANAKTLFADTYHGVKPDFLQEYLNEYCYKFNRRYFGEDLFERLLMIGVSYQSDFEHRIYNKNIA